MEIRFLAEAPAYRDFNLTLVFPALVDGEPVPLRRKPIVVPPGHKQYDFTFTALSFDAGDRARFRYQLAGFDPAWVEADTHRTAHYGHLPPRSYTFHVIACNNEGVWNDVGASVKFTVEPYFYQTKSFFIFISALVLGSVADEIVRTSPLPTLLFTSRSLGQAHGVEIELEHHVAPA